MTAVLPSPESAAPYSRYTAVPGLENLLPCCVQTSPERVKIHAAPWPSADPPISAVLPSAASATARPCDAKPSPPLPTSFPPCCVQTSPERMNTHAAPAPLSSDIPPTRAVFPSAESATAQP